MLVVVIGGGRKFNVQVPNKELVLAWFASALRLRQCRTSRKCRRRTYQVMRAPLNLGKVFLFVGPANNSVPADASAFDNRD